MLILLTIALVMAFVAAIGSVVLISIDRAAALVDKPATDLVLRLK